MKYRIVESPRWMPSLFRNGRRVQYRIYTVVEFHEGGWWTLEDFVTSINVDAQHLMYSRLHECIGNHCETILRLGLCGDRTDRFQAAKTGQIITALAPLERLEFAGGVQ